MKILKVLSLALVTAFILTSCNKKVYFNDSMRTRIESGGDKNIEKIQFYNSDKIVLQLKTTSKSKELKGGKVKFKNGYYYYTIKIPKETPAIAKYLDSDKLKVYFEKGEDRYLIFGKSDHTYDLLGRNESDGFYVNFEGKKMKVLEYGNLMIRKKSDVKVSKKDRKVKGLKL